MKKNIAILLLLSCGLIFSRCNPPKNDNQNKIEEKGLTMAVRMADSEMEHFPKASTVDFNPEGKWNYTGGLVAMAMMKLWEKTGEEKYYNYAKSYADEFIGENGEIDTYKKSDFNIDKINSGKFLFDLYKNTNDERYKKAIYILRDQLKDHPRTTEGGFWHKKVYPNQMWLDGLYMGSPFYAQFGKTFDDPQAFDDVINQFVTVHKHTYNPQVGLNYHGWDESKSQQWADSVTGCSPNFWGRAMGWYAMALVDALDFIPDNYPGRSQLVDILNEVAAEIKKFQDEKTGLWYQVLDQGAREGNYFEASASSMFVYALAKAARRNYIPQEYNEVAEKGYRGDLDYFIKENEDGTISLTKVCAVAGLGGDPYRSGTFDYT